MPVIKLREGLLEKDNFYLTSSFSDFLGNGVYAKSLDYFELKSGEIKRNFQFQEFVVDVVKQNSQLQEEEKHQFFVEVRNKETGKLYKIGICEEYEGGAVEGLTYWRIICYDGFVQTYVSQDGITWLNVGGQKLIDEEVVYQGFSVEGSTSLIFKEYKVYNGSFVTMQNFEQNFKVELYDLQDNLIKARVFDEEMEAKIFLNYELEGYFKVYDTTDNLVFTSDSYKLSPGDTYSYTPYELELIYKDQVLDYGPTHLTKELQRLQLKNIGLEAYENLKIISFNATSKTDIIELSLDGIAYASSITIESLMPEQTQDIYVKITKAQEYDFTVNEFELRIY